MYIRRRICHIFWIGSLIMLVLHVHDKDFISSIISYLIWCWKTSLFMIFSECQGKSALDMVKTSESLYLNFNKCITFGYFTCLTLKCHNKTVILPVSHWSITIKWYPLGIENLMLCGLSILLDPSVYYMECTMIII